MGNGYTSGKLDDEDRQRALISGILRRLAALEAPTGTSVTSLVTQVQTPADPVTTILTTGTLASNAVESGLVTFSGARWVMLQMLVSRPCRVRLYDSAAHRDADVLRARGVDPVTANNPGVMLDWAFQATPAAPITLCPPAPGAVFPASTSVPYTIDNLDASAGTVQVSFVYIINR